MNCEWFEREATKWRESCRQSICEACSDMHYKQASGRDHTVTDLQAVTNCRRGGAYFLAVNSVLEEKTEMNNGQAAACEGRDSAPWRYYQRAEQSQAEARFTVATYLAAVDRVVAEMTEEQEREQRVIAERQRRLGELGDKINDIKRKRRAAQDDEELDRGVKKAKALFKATTTYP